MLTNIKQKIKIRQFLNPKSFYINVRLDLLSYPKQENSIWRLVMSAITGCTGYPNKFQVEANPTGAGLANLNAEYARDFGLGLPQVYDLPLNVSMGFGPGMYGGMYGVYGMGMGMYGPYGPSQQYLKYMNMDYKERLAYDAALRDYAREHHYVEGKNIKNYASATDGLAGSIREACNSLQTVVVEGQTDQIVEQFEKIVDMIRRSPLYDKLQEEFKNDPVALEKTLRDCAKRQYQAATGQDLKAMIQQNCDGAIANGFWDALSFGNAQRYTAEEVIARLEGTEAPKSDKVKKTVGKIGACTTYAATGAAIGVAFGGPVGAAIGAGVGAVVGIIGSICS